MQDYPRGSRILFVLDQVHFTQKKMRIKYETYSPDRLSNYALQGTHHSSSTAVFKLENSLFSFEDQP